MTKSSKQIYTFLGLPGSGKGTQVDLFATRHNLAVIGIGDLVRRKLEENDENDPFLAEIKQRYKDGIPQRDEVVFDLVRDALDQNAGGVVFDNFPFTLPQVDFIDSYTKENDMSEPIIIFLKVDPETVIKRITQRRVCSECGAIYMGNESTMCEKCGAALVARSDDNEDTVRTRIEQYLPRIKEVVEIYREKGRVLEIDGEPSVKEVNQSVEEAISRLKS